MDSIMCFIVGFFIDFFFLKEIFTEFNVLLFRG